MTGKRAKLLLYMILKKFTEIVRNIETVNFEREKSMLLRERKSLLEVSLVLILNCRNGSQNRMLSNLNKKIKNKIN